MKYFICALDKVQLGIPTSLTERIIPAGRVQTTVSESENQERFISIPALFRLKDSSAPHGIVLKQEIFGKTVLLTPKIDIEIEIPQEHIHALPKALAGNYAFFSGAYCSGQNIILILDPQKTVEGLQ